MFRSHHQKIRDIIIRAPIEEGELRSWLSNCTSELRQDLFKYCTKMSKESEAKKERADITKLILKYLPVLKTLENADKFLLESCDDPYSRLQKYPMDLGDFSTLWLKVSDFQKIYVARDKLALILKNLKATEDKTADKDTKKTCGCF